MHTVMTHNNGYDAILLVTNGGGVVSAWTATRETVQDYVTTGHEPELWEAGIGDLDINDCTAISDYGTEVGRNGRVDSEERSELWGLY